MLTCPPDLSPPLGVCRALGVEGGRERELQSNNNPLGWSVRPPQ